MWYKLWRLKQNYMVTVFKVIHYGFEIFQTFKPELQNHVAKNIKLGDKIVTNL